MPCMLVSARMHACTHAFILLLHAAGSTSRLRIMSLRRHTSCLDLACLLRDTWVDLDDIMVRNMPVGSAAGPLKVRVLGGQGWTDFSGPSGAEQHLA